MKKYIRCVLLLTMAAMLLLSLTACGGIKIEDNPQARAGVDALLTALLEGDEEAGYKAVTDQINRKDFSQAFHQMAQLIADVESYELEPIGFNYQSRNGVTYRTMTYRMTTNDATFVVEAVVQDNVQGLLSFYITPEEYTALNYTGTPGHMEGASLAQWVVLAVGILSWVFVIWMAVDCCRRKIQRKWLWLIAIVLGSILLTLSTSASSVNLRFNIGIHLRLSSWIFYGNGDTQLNLLVPVGALLYLLRRKKLANSKEVEVTPPEPTEDPVFRQEME